MPSFGVQPVGNVKLAEAEDGSHTPLELPVYVAVTVRAHQLVRGVIRMHASNKQAPGRLLSTLDTYIGGFAGTCLAFYLALTSSITGRWHIAGISVTAYSPV